MAKPRKIPTKAQRERIKDCFAYDSDTGVMRRKVGPDPDKWPIYFTRSIDGAYGRVALDGRQYQSSHVAWFLGTGRWPIKTREIDHINRNPGDDRLVNLRQVTHEENMRNGIIYLDARWRKEGIPIPKGKPATLRPLRPRRPKPVLSDSGQCYVHPDGTMRHADGTIAENPYAYLLPKDNPASG